MKILFNKYQLGYKSGEFFATRRHFSFPPRKDKKKKNKR